VATAAACLEEQMHFMGIVKTARKQFPKAKPSEWVQNNRTRGSFTAMSTTTPPVLHAAVWNDAKPKFLISTRGTTIPADPVVRTRVVLDEDGNINKNEYQVPRPLMIKEFFDAFNAVDTNDQYRQGILRIEENWRTHRWDMRTFSTVLGVIVVNSYLLSQYMRTAHGSSQKDNTFASSVDRLAYKLIYDDNDNDSDDDGNDSSNNVEIYEEMELRRLEEKFSRHGTPQNLWHRHVLASLNQSIRYQDQGATLHCVVCHQKTHSFCVLCSDEATSHYVAVNAPVGACSSMRRGGTPRKPN
jgi:hypothetical protein